DRDLIDIWVRRLIVDAQDHDRAGMVGDLATIGVIRKRLSSANGGQFENEVAAMQQVIHSGDSDQILEHVIRLHLKLSR
ncbi:MAG: hypothetical protein FD129_2880, partial [bacterium]